MTIAEPLSEPVPAAAPDCKSGHREKLAASGACHMSTRSSHGKPLMLPTVALGLAALGPAVDRSSFMCVCACTWRSNTPNARAGETNEAQLKNNCVSVAHMQWRLCGGGTAPNGVRTSPRMYVPNTALKKQLTQHGSERLRDTCKQTPPPQPPPQPPQQPQQQQPQQHVSIICFLMARVACNGRKIDVDVAMHAAKPITQVHARARARACSHSDGRQRER